MAVWKFGSVEVTLKQASNTDPKGVGWAFTSGRRAQNASSEKNANARNLLTNN